MTDFYSSSNNISPVFHECCAGGLVFDTKSHVLMIRDKWGNTGVPKGQYNTTDVSALDCARREVREETGVEFDLAHDVELAYEEERIRRKYAPRGRIRKHVTLFVGKLREGRRRDDAHPSIRIQQSEIAWAGFVSMTEFCRLVSNTSLVAAAKVAFQLVGDLAGEQKNDARVLLPK